jgi:hypothetical protein
MSTVLLRVAASLASFWFAAHLIEGLSAGFTSGLVEVMTRA